MVEARHRRLDLAGLEARRRRQLEGKDDRPFAERDRLHVAVMRNGLGDDVDGIRIVVERRFGAEPFHLFDEGFDDVNRAQRHKKATRPLRLLPDNPMFEGNALI